MSSALKTLLFFGFICIGVLANAQNFIANLGQWQEAFEYKLQWRHAAVYLRQDGMRFHLQDPAAFAHFHNEKGQHELPTGKIKNHVFDVVFNSAFAEMTPAKKQQTYHNYYLGKNKKYWKSNVPLYEEIRYKKLYNGIDLVLKSGGANMKYDLLIAPGGNPASISWDYVGVDGLELDEGRLLIKTSVGVLVEESPIAWQIINGQTIKVDVAFNLSGNTIGFTLGEYNKNHELIIDPNYIFSTYTGSTADNFGYTATYDAAGNTYGAGIVFGNGYPTTSGAFDTIFNGGSIDIGISKFSTDGISLLYSTYLGGIQPDQPHSMVVDANDNLIVLGITGSSDFPVTPNALDTSFNGGPPANVSFMPFSTGVDMYIAKFNSAGTSLLASTFLGGTNTDGANLGIIKNYGDQARGEVIVSTAGDILFASSSFSTDFPVSIGAFQSTKGTGQDAVLGRLDSNLTALQWSTYIGGNNNDAGYSLKLNSTETTVFTAGGTLSTDFPVSANAYQSSHGGDVDGWIASFSESTGSNFASTYNGTVAYDQNFFVALDLDDDVYVFGQTKGAYPTTPNLWGVPGSSQYIHKLSTNLQQSKRSIVFGSGTLNVVNISPTALMVDGCKSVYLSGWGGSVNIEGTTSGMPVTPDAVDSTTDGNDFYLLVLDGTWQFPEYASFYGGPGAEHVDGGTSRFSPEGIIHQAVCAGCGSQSTFPTFPSNVWSTTNNSPNCNLAVFKIDFDLRYADVNVTLIPDSICLNNEVTFTDSSRNIDVMYWDFGDGTNYVGRTPNKFYNDTGVYTITIVGVDTLCFSSDTATLTLYVFNSFAQASFIADYDTCDLPFNVMLTNQSVSSISYLWDFGDGTTSTKINPTKTYGLAGSYIITLAAKDSVCDNWDTTRVTVLFHNSGGTVDFTLAYDYCVDWQKVELVPVNGNNYQIFSWDFGDGSSSTVKFPTHNYTQPGAYTIVLTAIDTLCKISTTASQTVDVYQYEQVADEIFPNVFTPNGDGVNDTWQILGDVSSAQFEEFRLEVYNRWGTKVLTSYDANYQWNGNYLDSDLADGVYFWLVWYTDICGNQNEKHGEVHILR